jgi:hypothetical protein
MLYVCKKTKNVHQDRFDRVIEVVKPTVIEPVKIENEIEFEKVEPVKIVVEPKRKVKKVEKLDNIENTEKDGCE